MTLKIDLGWHKSCLGLVPKVFHNISVCISNIFSLQKDFNIILPTLCETDLCLLVDKLPVPCSCRIGAQGEVTVAYSIRGRQAKGSVCIVTPVVTI